MTTDFRALCAELVDHARLAQMLLTGEGLWDGDEDDGLFDRARAALAEPEPPADGEVAELVADLREIGGILCGMEKHRWAIKLTRTAGLLERLASPSALAAEPEPPDAGEVAELVDRLRRASDGASAMGWDQDSWTIARAAELLERLAPQPVPESLKERPDFIAGYREGLADRKRINEHEEAERSTAAQLTPQPVPTRRVYFDMPSQIAECGGPCSEGGPKACDCGALWRDELVPAGPTNQEIEALHHAVFSSRLHGPPPNTSFEVDLVRAALARWGRP